jgi:CheY-like chemotaxis protein
MVLDLSLPDASGFTLLETLSRGDHAFPPVIVYTGHDLTADDEQRLRRYSSSIIIKGAKSPERLLDEVSLFLHQVVAELPPEQQRMIQKARNRDAVLEGRRILIVEDDVRNVFSLTSVLEPRGAIVQIARNGQEAIDALEVSAADPARVIDLVLMDVMMPVMDGLMATRTIRGDPQSPPRRCLMTRNGASRPGPTTTWLNPSTSTNCSRWSGCGCRDEGDSCATALRTSKSSFCWKRSTNATTTTSATTLAPRSSGAYCKRVGKWVSPAYRRCRPVCCTTEACCRGCWTI